MRIYKTNHETITTIIAVIIIGIVAVTMIGNQSQTQNVNQGLVIGNTGEYTLKSDLPNTETFIQTSKIDGIYRKSRYFSAETNQEMFSSYILTKENGQTILTLYRPPAGPPIMLPPEIILNETKYTIQTKAIGFSPTVASLAPFIKRPILKCKKPYSGMIIDTDTTFCPGTYVLTQGITIIAPATITGDNTTLQGPGICGGNFPGVPCKTAITIRAINVKITGMTLTEWDGGIATDYQFGIPIFDYIDIKNNTINNVTDSIRAIGIQNSTIQYNTLEGFQNILAAGSSSGTTYANNDISFNQINLGVV
jgi:hypothetical protein